MFKKILITLSVFLNVVLLIALCVYAFTTSLDMLAYQGAMMKFFGGGHEMGYELKEQYIYGFQCLEESGYFEDDGYEGVNAATEGFTLIEEGDMGNTYEGAATISGSYTYYASGAHGIPLIVEPDEEYLDLLPGDGERFAIANHEELLDIIMKAETKECDTYTGFITLEIDGYNELTAEIGGSDTTNFVSVSRWSSDSCD